MSSLLRAGFEVNDLAAYATAGWTFSKLHIDRHERPSGHERAWRLTVRAHS